MKRRSVLQGIAALPGLLLFRGPAEAMPMPTPPPAPTPPIIHGEEVISQAYISDLVVDTVHLKDCAVVHDHTMDALRYESSECQWPGDEPFEVTTPEQAHRLDRFYMAQEIRR